MKLKLSCGRRAVDPLPHRDERDAERLEFIEQCNQVSQITSEPIEPPADQHIELPSSSCTQQLVEGGPTILGTADTAIDVLPGGPVTRCGVPTKLGELVLWFLIDGANASVDGGKRDSNRIVDLSGIS
jgi:hypothetical protein